MESNTCFNCTAWFLSRSYIESMMKPTYFKQMGKKILTEICMIPSVRHSQLRFRRNRLGISSLSFSCVCLGSILSSRMSLPSSPSWLLWVFKKWKPNFIDSSQTCIIDFNTGFCIHFCNLFRCRHNKKD